jgi:Zn-dependent protease with chaperone function
MTRRVALLLGIWAALTVGCVRAASASSPGSAPPGQKGERGLLERVATGHFDPEFLARGRSYQRPRMAVFLVETALILLLALLVLATPWASWSRSILPRWLGAYSWTARLGGLTAVYLGFEMIQLPFSMFFYWHAKRAGIRHDPWSGFFADWVKGLGVGWVQVALVGMLVLWLLAAFPRWGWLLGAAGIGILATLYMCIAPIVIDPLFNRFHPLEDVALRDRLLGIAAQGGVPAKEILVADASRRTRAVNAYFTGFGRTRRIVLYDTLLTGFDHDEIAVILAHEVGHWKRHHVVMGLLWGTFGSLLGLGILSAFLGRALHTVPGLAGRADPALAVPAYALTLILLTLSGPPANFISRRMETQADRTSLELTRDPGAFIRSEVHLARENLSDVLPPAWIESLFYTHPCTARRIDLAERFS